MFQKLLYEFTDHRRRPTKLKISIALLVCVPLGVLILAKEAWLQTLIHIILIIEGAILTAFLAWRAKKRISFFKIAKKSQKREPGFTTYLVSSEKRLPD